MLLLLVHGVVLLRLIMVPLLSYFLGFLISKSIYQFYWITEKHQQTFIKLVLPLGLMNMKKVDEALDLLVFLATVLFLVVTFCSLMLVSSQIIFFWLLFFSLRLSFPFNTNFSVISLKEKVRIWCSFYWPAIFKMIWTKLGTFSQLECFFFLAKWSKEALFISLVNVFTSFWIFGEKKRVSKSNPILKYAVLWHSGLNTDGYYYISKLWIWNFSNIKKLQVFVK